MKANFLQSNSASIRQLVIKYDFQNKTEYILDLFIKITRHKKDTLYMLGSTLAHI